MSTLTMARRTLVSVAVFAVAASASAQTVVVVPRMIEALGVGGAAVSIVLPLRDGDRRVDLEEFALWAPDARIIVHGDSGTTEEPPPHIRTYRGTVEGDPASMAVMTVDAGGNVRGVITTGDDRYQLTSEPQSPNSPEKPGRLRRARAEDQLPSRSTWSCAVDAVRTLRAPARPPSEALRTSAAQPAGLSGNQTYAARLEIETDYELFRMAGSDSALKSWVTSLTNALAAIYSRELQTTVLIHNVRTYETAASCPWTVQPSQGITAAMYQLGDYYHLNYPSVPRSAVVLLSGKAFGAGTSWEASLCGGDFQCQNGNCGDPGADGHWGGAYAVCGSVTNGQVPNPDATQNGIASGLPSTDFWPLQEYAHELGHILGGRHTNCIALSAADQTQFNTARAWVDYCYSGEYGCYTGGVSAPTEKGTIMSACFNVLDTYPSSRYVFGKAGEASYVELRDYMTRAAGTVDGGPNIVSAAQTVTMSPITAPSTVTLGSTGNAASVTPASGATYEWLITNGTITSGATSSQVTFSAPASGSITLRCSVYNSSGCAGVTDLVTVQVANAPASPPGSVYAFSTSASSVDVHWSAVTPPQGTSVYYNVYRTEDRSTYSLVGCTAATLLIDTSVASTKAYLYKVHAVYGAMPAPCAVSTGESGDSNLDLATPAGYMATINPGVAVTAAHINSLRSTVTAVYKLVYGAAASMPLTDPVIVSCAGNPSQCTTIKAVHLTELRNYLNSARSQLSGIGAWTFTSDPSLTSCNPATPSTCITIKAADFNELRTAADGEGH
jgi:hypothetical protein